MSDDQPIPPAPGAADSASVDTPSQPPPANDGFFAQHPAMPPPKGKGVISGCFWAMLIGAGVLGLVIIAAVVILVAGGASLLQGSLGDIKLESSGGMPKYQESYVTGERGSANKIALVHVQGVITGSEESGFGGGKIASAPAIVSRLRHLLKDESVKALIIRIDSPGGEVTASDEIYHMVDRIRKERKIPVVASMGSLAASGGYYVAVGCDYIVAHRMTTTGSIGVIIQGFKYYELFQKIGLRGEAYTSGKMKDMLSGDRPTTPEEAALVQKLVNDVYGDFVGVVAKGRKIPETQIRTTMIGDGRVFLGVEAQKLGLVDQLGYFEDAVAQAAKMAKLGNDYKVVSLNPPFSLAALFGQMESRNTVRSLQVQLPGGTEGFQLEQGRIYLLPREFARQP